MIRLPGVLAFALLFALLMAAPVAAAPDRPAALAPKLAGVRFVLLGEVHDNPAHHRLQAELVSLFAEGGSAPPVVFEMLDPSQQPAVDAFLAGDARDADAFAAAVRWSESGWPDFALYRPLFEAVLESGSPIRAAGLPAGVALAPDAPERDDRFGLGEPLPPDEHVARLDEMFAAHCELMPRESLAPMVEMQRARDARLAHRLLEAAGTDGRAVLVAGNGHVRNGAVPALLVRAGVPRDQIASVGLLERSGDDAGPADDDFDHVLETEPAEREDPCEGLARRLEGRS